MNRTQRDLILLAAGVGLGVGLGMLLAPRSGQETREEIRRGAGVAVDRGRSYWERLRNRGAGAEEAAIEIEG